MGVPIILGAFAGRFVRDVGMNMAMSAATQAAASLLSGISREATYAGNRAGPNVRPPYEMLVDLYNRDWISKENLHELAKDLGIHVGHNAGDSIADRIWNIALEASQFEIGINEALSLYRQGSIDRAKYRQILTNNGVYYDAKVRLIESLSDPLPAETCIALWWQGEFSSKQTLRNWLTMAGITNNDVQDSMLLVSRPISPEAGMQLYYRGEVKIDDVNQLLQQAGYVNEVDQKQWYQSAEQIPSASDLVSFAVREVWDQSVVERFGFDEEFDNIPEFHWWMNVAGYYGKPWTYNSQANQTKQRNRDGSLQDMSVEGFASTNLDSWAKAYWRAHWQLPSPTQGYEFLHRLRPERIERFRQLVPDVQPWTFADMQLLLKTADYPKPFRDRLAAVSYRTITRVDLRRLYDLDVIDRDEVLAYNLDYGYVKEDAERLTEWIVRDKSRRRLKKARENEQKRTVRLFKLGVLESDEATKRLERLGMSSSEAKIEVATVDADMAEQQVVLAQRNIETLYTQWAIDAEQAKDKLRAIGIVESAVMRLMETWKLKRESKGRHVTASQIARWVVRGVIRPGDAVRRLVSMGYDKMDATRIIRVARQDEEVIEARARKATAADQRQLVRAAEAEIRALERATEKAKRRLAVGGTPALLKRWLKNGTIGTNEVYRRLIALGWQPDDANRLILDVTGKPADDYLFRNQEQRQEQRP